jgi:carboxypeptidase Q
MKVLFLFFLLTVTAFAQQPAAAPTPELYSAQTLKDMKAIQQAALQSDYAYRQTAYLSNNIGPRLTGSAQAAQAVKYVEAELKKLGLEVRLEKVMVPHWVRGEERGELTQFTGMAPGTVQKIVLTALGGSVATPTGGITAEIVVVNDFAELQALGKDKLAGKIVLFNNKFNLEMARAGQAGAAYGQAVAYRFAGAGAAAPFGALAALVRSAGTSENRLAHTGAMGYPDGVTKIPTAAVSNEDADLIAYLAAQGATKIHLTLTPQTLPDTESYNVIGDLKGSEKPDEVVIVSGHLDSWDLGRGAIDDGSGVAAAMQVASVLRQLKLRPKRTIRVIAWMNEENGGRGSAGYFADETANVAKHFAAIEMDFGPGHPLGFAFAGKEAALPYFAPISNVLVSQGAFQVQTAANVGADTARLTAAGVPSFAPLSDASYYFDYHHTAADTLDKVNPKNLAENASVLSVLAYGLANLQQPLPR